MKFITLTGTKDESSKVRIAVNAIEAYHRNSVGSTVWLKSDLERPHEVKEPPEEIDRMIASTGISIISVSSYDALVEALKNALPYMKHAVKFFKYQRSGREFSPNREEAEGNIRDAESALRAAGVEI